MGITKKDEEKIRAMKSAGYETFEIARHFNVPEAIVVNVIEKGFMKKERRTSTK